MVYRVALIMMIALVFAASVFAHRQIDRPTLSAASPTAQCRRIISVSPSITETLYALGLGDRVVGVTRYCAYPSEVKQKPQIGGYYDPNFEAVVALKPDLVVMLEEHEHSLPGFKQLKLKTLVVSHQSVNGVIESFRTIGRACGKEAEGERLAGDYEKRLRRLHDRDCPNFRVSENGTVPFEPRQPRVLLALDRTFGRGHLADVYVAGVDDYFDRIIQLAGGQNAYRERGVRNPVVSIEGISWLNPDIIIDMVPKEIMEQFGRPKLVADWNELARVEAVKNRRVLIFDQDYAWVPGPRFIQLVEDLAEVIHGTKNEERGTRK